MKLHVRIKGNEITLLEIKAFEYDGTTKVLEVILKDTSIETFNKVTSVQAIYR